MLINFGGKKEKKKNSNKNVYFSVLCRRYINISTINVKPGSEVSKYVFGDDFINAHLAHFLQFTWLPRTIWR